jgi:hypothetical protein
MTFTIVPIGCGDIVNHERSCFLYRKNCGSAPACAVYRVAAAQRSPLMAEI